MTTTRRHTPGGTPPSRKEKKDRRGWFLSTMSKATFDSTWDAWMGQVLTTTTEPRFYYEGLVLHG